VAQFPAKMGELGVETAWKAVKGETVEPNVDTGTAVVTSENAAEFK
jgi:ABC-type sugar transport system substrate-binding protein